MFFFIQCRNRHVQPCRRYAKNGKCDKGEQCHYAHVNFKRTSENNDTSSNKKVKVESAEVDQVAGTSNNATAAKEEEAPKEPIVMEKIEEHLWASIRRRISEQIVTGTGNQQLEPMGEFVALSVSPPPEGDGAAVDEANVNDSNSGVELIDEMPPTSEGNSDAAAKKTARPFARLERKPKTFVLDNEDMPWSEFLNNMANNDDTSKGVVVVVVGNAAGSRPALKIIPDHLMADEVEEPEQLPDEGDNDHDHDDDQPINENEEGLLVDIMCDPLLDVALSTLGLKPMMAKLGPLVVIGPSTLNADEVL